MDCNWQIHLCNIDKINSYTHLPFCGELMLLMPHVVHENGKPNTMYNNKSECFVFKVDQQVKNKCCHWNSCQVRITWESLEDFIHNLNQVTKSIMHNLWYNISNVPLYDPSFFILACKSLPTWQKSLASIWQRSLKTAIGTIQAAQQCYKFNK